MLTKILSFLKAEKRLLVYGAFLTICLKAHWLGAIALTAVYFGLLWLYKKITSKAF